ncbi:hypothetical protein CI102_9809 [Trichoderma harzianum]|nr:hypothetical protein CI102_9809 [Trichoderma harzianum]
MALQYLCRYMRADGYDEKRTDRCTVIGEKRSQDTCIPESNSDGQLALMPFREACLMEEAIASFLSFAQALHLSSAHLGSPFGSCKTFWAQTYLCSMWTCICTDTVWHYFVYTACSLAQHFVDLFRPAPETLLTQSNTNTRPPLHCFCWAFRCSPFFRGRRH